MGNSTYSQKLNHPKWQRKRLEIMQRDNFKCTICGNDEDELNVHHLYYVSGKAVYDYDNEYLVTLCKDCHQATHNEISKISALIAYQVVKNGKTYFDICKTLNVQI